MYTFLNMLLLLNLVIKMSPDSNILTLSVEESNRLHHPSHNIALSLELVCKISSQYSYTGNFFFSNILKSFRSSKIDISSSYETCFKPVAA